MHAALPLFSEFSQSTFSLIARVKFIFRKCFCANAMLSNIIKLMVNLFSEISGLAINQRGTGEQRAPQEFVEAAGLNYSRACNR